jgi:hypothetical protein
MFLNLQMKYGLQHIAKLKNLAFAKLLYYFCKIIEKKMSTPNVIDKDNLKVIQTRKEYLESLMNQLGSGQVSNEKLVGDVAQELKNLYSLVEGLQTEIIQLKGHYEFLLNIMISMPEIQKNTALIQKIQERFPENSHP